MLKKTGSLAIIIMFASSTMYAMDNFLNMVSSSEAKNVENAVVGFATSPEGKKIEGEVVDFVKNEVTNFTSAKPTTTNNQSISGSAQNTETLPSLVINDNGSEKPRTKVPNLDLDSNAVPMPLKRAQTTTLSKTPIKNTHQLKNNVKQTALTERSARASNNDTVINISALRKSSPVSQQSDDFPNDNKAYTLDEVWVIINKVSPTLCKFAQDNNLPLNDLLMYAEFKNQLEITPEAIVDFINTHKLPDETKIANWNQAQQYKKIKKEDPQKYKEIVLEMFKTVMEQENGTGQASPLTDTHMQLAEKKIGEQDTTIKRQWMGIAASVVTFLLTVGWGIYAQVTATQHPTTTAPTFMPTSSPTYSPTFMPTLMPTGAPT